MSVMGYEKLRYDIPSLDVGNSIRRVHYNEMIIPDSIT